MSRLPRSHTPPLLFDPALRAQRLERAARSPEPCDFLAETTVRDLTERLGEVNRTFRAPAYVGPNPAFWSGHLQKAELPEPKVVPEAEVLDLDAEAHDLVVHALSLHASNDPVGQLIQARRALVPDGLLLGATLGGRTLAELRAVLADAEAMVTGGLSPRVAPMAEIRDLGALLQRAGFAMPVVDSLVLRVRYASVRALMHDLRAMGETNVLRERLRRPTRRAVFETASTLYTEFFGSGDGGILATFEVIVLTGWAPSESQPRALRPGTARARLAEALGSIEVSAGEKAGPGTG
jgi:hypothetical protein